MSTVTLDFVGASGMSVKATLQRLSDGYYREDDSETFVNAPAFTDKDIAFTAGTGENTGYYSKVITTTDYEDGLYLYRVHNTGASNVVIGSATFYLKAGEDISYLAQTNIYSADINVSKDVSADKYTVVWYKNGNRIDDADDISNVKLSVYERDGSALFTLRSMTELIDEMGASVLNITVLGERQTSGENYVVIGYADIDGDTRSFSWILGRDY